MIMCSICNEEFSNISSFVPHRLRHFKTQHLDPFDINMSKPFSCEICHQNLNHHQKVQAHFLAHLRDKRPPKIISKKTMIELPVAAQKQKAGIPKILDFPRMVSAKKSIGGGSPKKVSNEVSPYVCKLCLESFQNKQNYGAHIRHYCTKRHVCSKCSKSFSSSNALAGHQRNCSDLLRCKHCSLEFISLNEKGWHEKICVKVNESEASCNDSIHNNLISVWPPTADDHLLQCLLCKENYYESSALENHFSECHPSEEFQTICLPCDFTFSDSQKARFHVMSPLGQDIMEEDAFSFDQSFSSETSVEPVENANKKKMGHRCKYCNQNFVSASRLKSHLVIHEPFHCHICNGKEYTTEGLFNHPCTTADGKFTTGIKHRKKWCKQNMGREAKLRAIRRSTSEMRDEEFAQSDFSNECMPNSDIHIDNMFSAGTVLSAQGETSKMHWTVLDEPSISEVSRMHFRTDQLNSVGSSSISQSAVQRDIVKLREDFSQLMCLLVSDRELMLQLGWGAEPIDQVLHSALVHLGVDPIQLSQSKGGNVEQQKSALCNNISIFLKLSIKEDILRMKSGESMENVITRMLKMCSQ